MAKADIAVVGLAVMGENLILNMESKGFTVACYNRTVSKVDDFINGRAKGKNIIGCRSIEEMVANLKTPRKVMLYESRRASPWMTLSSRCTAASGSGRPF
jgi:6-phosphogluconate dehydrogenase